MVRVNQPASRTGAIVPLAALSLIGLVSFVALAIDLSLLVIGRTQAQSAADVTAMAACRDLNGDVASNNNIASAFTTGSDAATQSAILGKTIASSQLELKIGTLYYDKTVSPPRFKVSNLTTSAGPPPTGYNWGVAQAKVSGNVDFYFAKLFGMASLPVDAYAEAIHRPRDVAIIMDFSGSMYFDSYMVAPKSGSGSTWNPPYRALANDPRVPRFGHYDANTTANSNSNDPPHARAYLQTSELPSPYDGDHTMSTNEIMKIGNNTYTTTSGDPIVEDFWTLNGSSAMVKAFNNPSSSHTPVTDYDSHNFPNTVPNYTGTSPAGIRPVYVNTVTNDVKSSTYAYSYTAGTEYAKNIEEYLNLRIINSSPSADIKPCPTIRRPEWEGAAAIGSNSGNSVYNTTKCYTYGPGYWGKTFFVWPPNPDDTAIAENPPASSWSNHNNSSDGGPIRDWRQRFYWKINNSNGKRYRLDDNNILWTSEGKVRPRDQSNMYTDSNGITWRYEINYNAVLYWLKNDGPNPMPGNLRAGRILYYASIPDNVDDADTNYDHLFWKRYIDYVFGWEASANTGSGSTKTMNLRSGFGNDFSWATASAPSAIYTKPSDQHLIGRVNYTYGYSSGYGPDQDIRVRLPSSVGSTGILYEVPQVGDQIKFSNHSTIYTISSVNTSSNPWKIQLDDDLTSSVSSSTDIYLLRTGACMDARDNPYRPKMRWWFGPLSFTDFCFCDYDSIYRNWRPGNCHEAPMWILKAGIQSALADIEKNHPNDWVSLIYFSVPKNSSSANVDRRFNRVRGALGKNYSYMQNALWYPPAVIQSDGSLVSRGSTSPPGEIRPWTLNFGLSSDYQETPMALGGTCPSWGFQLAYNQFSSYDTLVDYDSSYPAGTAGGNGRLGARKLVIFETDGVPNHSSSSSFQDNGASFSYWRCRQPDEWPTVSNHGNMHSSALNACYDAVRVLCDNGTGTRSGSVSVYYSGGTTTEKTLGTSYPGYATTNKPVYVHSLAFGGLFESTSSLKQDCLNFLQSVQTIGGTQTVASTALPSYKVITGTSTQRIDKIKEAFTIMMQDGVQITLYK